MQRPAAHAATVLRTAAVFSAPQTSSKQPAACQTEVMSEVLCVVRLMITAGNTQWWAIAASPAQAPCQLARVRRSVRSRQELLRASGIHGLSRGSRSRTLIRKQKKWERVSLPLCIFLLSFFVYYCFTSSLASSIARPHCFVFCKISCVLFLFLLLFPLSSVFLFS